MPAYFSVETEFDRNALSATFAKDLFQCLSTNGMSFYKGAFASEGYSLEQQIFFLQGYFMGGY